MPPEDLSSHVAQPAAALSEELHFGTRPYGEDQTHVSFTLTTNLLTDVLALRYLFDFSFSTKGRDFQRIIFNRNTFHFSDKEAKKKSDD